MKNKIRSGIIFLIVIAIVIAGVELSKTNKDEKVKGNLELLVNEEEYDYLVKCANKFMELNDKTNISVIKENDVDGSADIINNKESIKISSIGELDRTEIESIGKENLVAYEEQKYLLEAYSKNFSSYRTKQVKVDGNIIGIPLTSRPLAFYVREDMIKQYGYKRQDMNTWADLIKVGKDIYEKSNGEVHILNATGQDYKDLVDLLVMQNLKSDSEVSKVEEEVKKQIDELKNNNILNLNDGGEFLARISSINGMREIMAIELPTEWSAGTVPSIQAGGNKFFAAEGKNLIILNESQDNKKLTEKFISYVITNTKDALDNVIKGEFFSSYLYTYKSSEIEKAVNNFSGTSPLVVLSNIEEKTLEIQDYEKYIEIKNSFAE